MSRLSLAAVSCLCLAAPAIFAQSPNPLVDEVRYPYTLIRTNLLKMAEKMPAEFYSFRPVPEIETFAQRVAHIAGADLGACTGVLTNTARPLAPAAGATKAELIAVLKQAMATCDKAFDATTDKNAYDQVSARLGGPFPPGVSTRTRLFTLSNMVRHTNEVYGYMCVYLRLKGIVPPSSAPE
jgi:hypothetical protein